MLTRFAFLLLIALVLATPSSPFHPYIAARKLAKRTAAHTKLRPSTLASAAPANNETLLRAQILPNTTANVGQTKKKQPAYANGHTFVPNLPPTTWKHGAWEAQSNHTNDRPGDKPVKPHAQTEKKNQTGQKPGHANVQQMHWHREDVDDDRVHEQDMVRRPSGMSTGHSHTMHVPAAVGVVSPFSKGVVLFLLVIAFFIGRFLLRMYAKAGAKKARALRKRLNPAAMA